MKKRLTALLLSAVLLATGALLTACKDSGADLSDDVTSDVVSVESEVSSELSSVEETSSVQSEVSSKAPQNSSKKTTSTVLSASNVSKEVMFPSKWAPTKAVSELPTLYKEKVKSGKIDLLTSTKIQDNANGKKLTEVAETFKKLTGKTLEINQIVVDWSSMRQQLQTMVIAKNGPDVWGSMYQGATVYIRNKNVSRDINEYINMNDAAFKAMQDACGLTYYTDPKTKKGLLAAVSVTDISYDGTGILYNKNMMKQAGLEDPVALWRKNQWNMDNFLKYIEKLTVVKGGVTERYGFSGVWYEVLRMGATSGEDIITILPNGKFKNNIDSDVWTRWASYMRKITELKSWDPECLSKNNVVLGKSAMRICNPGDLFDEKDVNKLYTNGTLGWVPIPNDPKANVYRNLASYQYYLLPENSDNAWGGAAFIYALRYNNANVDKAAEKQRYMKEYGFSEEQYNFVRVEVYEKSQPAFYFWQHMMGFNEQDMSGVVDQDWASFKEQVKPKFDAAVKEANR